MPNEDKVAASLWDSDNWENESTLRTMFTNYNETTPQCLCERRSVVMLIVITKISYILPKIVTVYCVF